MLTLSIYTNSGEFKIQNNDGDHVDIEYTQENSRYKIMMAIMLMLSI